MKKGWLLDYEIKQAFCSPLCHVTYRQLKWEEAEKLQQVQLMPSELEISKNNNQSSFDWEREGLRQEVLYWREYTRQLEQRLASNPPTTVEERQQSNYLLRLQRNTLQSVEQSYQGHYGDLIESDKNKPINLTPWIIGGAAVLGIAITWLLGYLLGKSNSKDKK
jgi:hypothetical protein